MGAMRISQLAAGELPESRAVDRTESDRTACSRAASWGSRPPPSRDHMHTG
ncbi:MULTISPECIES: hypothetical protein [unclassified Streptomyces]|uniref:hypothetical protein n=1 Tax=unclassified Streptomyces TaxID=2593676 RepID=UPI0013007D22|nr:hypothetical protein [Streptomyces sp. DH-12]